jgi:hypothetical protein
MPHARRTVAGLVLVAVLGFGAWVVIRAAFPELPGEVRSGELWRWQARPGMEAQPGTQPAIRLQAQLGGAVTKVAFGDGHIFAGVGPRLVMLDDAAGGDPVQLAESMPLPGRITALAALAGAIAVGYGIQDAGDPNGLALFGTDPASPLPALGHVPLKGVPVALLARGDTLIVATRQQTTDDRPYPTPRAGNPGEPADTDPGIDTYHDSAILVVDAASRTAPRVVGTMALDEVPSALAGTGSTVFVMTTAHHANGDSPGVLQAVDVSNPTELRRLGSLEIGGDGPYGAGLALDAGYAFAAVGDVDPGVAIIDVRDPSHMRTVANIEFIGNAVALVGHCLYVADLGEASVYDVTDATQPEWLGYVGLDIRDVVVDGDRLVIAEDALSAEDETTGNLAGLGVFSVAEGPLAPTRIGRWRSLVDMTSMAPDETHVYVTVADHLVAAIDTRDPAHPRRSATARWRTGGWGLTATDMTLAEDTLAMTEIGAGSSALSLAKIGADGLPQPAEALALHAHAVGIAADGRLVAALVEPEFNFRGPTPVPVDKALRLYRVTDDGSAVLAGEAAVPGGPAAVAMRGSAVYVASSTGLHVFDVTDPSQTRLVRSVANFRAAGNSLESQRISLGGGHLAVAATDGVRLFDTSDPLAPRHVGDLPIAGLRALAVSPDLLFTAVREPADSSRLVAYRLNDLAGGAVFETQLPSPVRSLAMQGDALVALTEGTGIYWFGPGSPPVTPLLNGLLLPQLTQQVR